MAGNSLFFLTFTVIVQLTSYKIKSLCRKENEQNREISSSITVLLFILSKCIINGYHFSYSFKANLVLCKKK